jgi:hypothetical protein
LININKQAHKDDNKLAINIHDTAYGKQFQTNKLENKEKYHSSNRSAPDTDIYYDILTEKRIQGNK